MLEPSVLVRCLKRDVEVCKSLVGEIQQEYRDYIRKELDIEKTIDVAVDTENFLEQRSYQNAHGNVKEGNSSSLMSHRISKTDEMKKWYI